jgi:signal transduction histidine kinase
MLVLGNDLNSWPSWVEDLWYGMWICGVAAIWGCSKQGLFPGKGGQLTRRLLTGALFLFAPVSLVASILGGNWYGLYVAPLASVLLQFLIFLGVIHFRFYDVEVTVARRGNMATRAAEAERWAVVGELAASVAHEVRNPLTGVRSLAQRLADDSVDESKRRDYARIILSETQRVEDIVTSLLNLAKGAASDRTTKASIALAPLFADLSLLLKQRAEEESIVIEIDPNEVSVVVSRDALAQALLNLLLNALNHTPPGGRINLVAHPNGDGVDVLVRDSGPGIPEAEREEVFEPLHTGGLGLAVVRRLAREQGWIVSVDDGPNGGAEFCVHIQS